MNAARSAVADPGAIRARLEGVFPGWWIALGGAALLGLIGGLLLQSYGAYVVVLQQDLGWSTTMLASAYALLRLESGLIGPLQGWLIDRFGPRASMRAGVLMLGTGFLLFSRIQTPAQFFGAFVVMSVGASMAGIMPVSTTIVSWFRRRRARALSIALLGVAAGGMAVPLVAFALESWSWRPTAVASGILVLTAGLALTQLFHHRPEDIGLTVDGDPPGDPYEADAQAGSAAPEFTARQALRTRAFWAISIGHAATVGIVSTLMVHMVPYLTRDLGFTLSEASLAVLLVTLLQLAGIGVGGAVGDRIDKRVATATCAAMHGVGLLVLAAATSWSMVILAGVVQGLAWGVRGPLMQGIRADYFGRGSYGKIIGWSSVLIMLGSSGGPLFSGILYDATGSYQLVFRLVAGAGLVGMVAFLLARPPGSAPVAHPRAAVPS